MRRTTLMTLALAATLGCQHVANNANAGGKPDKVEKVAPKDTHEVVKSDEEWKKILTAEQFDVLRRKGTERAFTGKYHDSHVKATYLCAGCNLPLFRSEEKFDSGTGWPSFWQPIAKEAVETDTDSSYGMDRTEVRCHRCGGHLGHLFPDGPKPTGQRYCINSAALKQEPR